MSSSATLDILLGNLFSNWVELDFIFRLNIIYLPFPYFFFSGRECFCLSLVSGWTPSSSLCALNKMSHDLPKDSSGVTLQHHPNHVSHNCVNCFLQPEQWLENSDHITHYFFQHLVESQKHKNIHKWYLLKVWIGQTGGTRL